MNPKISVIMSAYNSENYLEECINSILNQTFRDFELVIVDDGSTDSTSSIIKKFNDKRIILIENEENIGLTRSLNKALKISRGDFIARQDADDISAPSRFKKQIEYFHYYDDVVLVGTDFNIINEDGEKISRFMNLKKPTFDDLIKANRFQHGSVMFKKEQIIKVGGYNELFRYVQDYDLWLRLSANYEVRNINIPLYSSRVHGDTIGFTNVEESELYRILAIKIAKGEINRKGLNKLGKNGIKYLYTFLNDQEKAVVAKKIKNVIKFMEYTNQNQKISQSDNFNNLKRSSQLFTIKIYYRLENLRTYVKNQFS